MNRLRTCTKVLELEGKSMSIISKVRKILKDQDNYDWNSIGEGSAAGYKLDALIERCFHKVSPEQYFGNRFYELSKRERRKYIPTGSSWKFSVQMEERCSKEELESIWNKYRFNQTYAEFIKREFLFTGEGTTEHEIRDFIQKHHTVIVKETDNTQGKGIFMVSFDQEDISQIITDLHTNAYLLEEIITQHPKLAELNPTSVNTVRVGTALDAEGKAHALGACLRVGGKGAVVDNYHSGGVAYPLDLEHGIVCGSGRTSDVSQDYIIHPSTGKVMLGFEIPNWDLIIETVLRAAEKSTALRYLGWDIAVTEKGCELVEANIGHDPQVIQLDRVGKKALAEKYLGIKFR